MEKRITVIAALVAAIALLSACSTNLELAEEQGEVAQVVAADTPVATESSTDEETTGPRDSSTVPTVAPTSSLDLTVSPLPERAGPRVQTSGTVPHVQIGVEPVTAVNDELYRRVFALPGVEDRPTIVSLPGATGMWISEEIDLSRADAVQTGREFAHIHPDGSLHAPLPIERALEVAEKGWGERHPWADDNNDWIGVMLFTPQSMDELDITWQLIVESYNFVTGRTVQASDIQ